MAPTICIVGGRLQGMEAAYLSGKAGFRTILVDKASSVPALTLADEFYKIDVVNEPAAALKVISETDAVLPALEDTNALKALQRLCMKAEVRFMQDSKAFTTTCSKEVFARFCKRNDMPFPKISHSLSFPVIVKPVNGSGSRGISFARDKAELEAASNHLKEQRSRYIVQEYASGYFLSLELIGMGGSPLPLQVTCLEFDESYGCKRVIAPCTLESAAKGTISQGKKLVEGLNLTGLTDIQTVLRRNRVETIEANARIPSQTPTVVYHSTGVNMVELLFRLFTENSLPPIALHNAKAVIYQHLILEGSKLKVTAEHALSDASGIGIEKQFYSVDEAITNFSHKCNGKRVATLIAIDSSLAKAKARMEETVKSISSDYSATIEDTSPWGIKSAYDEIDI